VTELRLPEPIRLGALAERHGGAVDAAARDLVVVRIRPLDRASAGDLAPLTSSRHLASARASTAALLVDAGLADGCPEGRRWIHPHASWVLAGLLGDIEGRAQLPAEPSYVSTDARVDPSAEVGPFAVILGDAVVGPASVIGPHAVIYGRVRIGARVIIGASAVLGRPGFGWARGPDGSLRRIPQLGGVIVEDDVEIGPLSTIDAGTLAPTVVGAGARLDAQVHVGHNVEVGRGTLVAAQSGFAGSVVVGTGVQVGGQAGVADHVHIGSGARVAAKAGVIGDVPPGVTVAGYPAVERARWLRGVARMLRRPGKLK
jgi:UDP-3-O-[3-hydroxymyristoyl] glucosamine N-acyltransferase